jgi:hypothetical protein
LTRKTFNMPFGEPDRFLKVIEQATGLQFQFVMLTVWWWASVSQRVLTGGISVSSSMPSRRPRPMRLLRRQTGSLARCLIVPGIGGHGEVSRQRGQRPSARDGILAPTRCP